MKVATFMKLFTFAYHSHYINLFDALALVISQLNKILLKLMMLNRHFSLPDIKA